MMCSTSSNGQPLWDLPGFNAPHPNPAPLPPSRATSRSIGHGSIPLYSSLFSFFSPSLFSFFSDQSCAAGSRFWGFHTCRGRRCAGASHASGHCRPRASLPILSLSLPPSLRPLRSWRRGSKCSRGSSIPAAAAPKHERVAAQILAAGRAHAASVSCNDGSGT